MNNNFNKAGLSFTQWIDFLLIKVPKILSWKSSYKDGNFKSRYKTAKCNYVTR
jgi:hypothetical protein